MFPSRPVRSTSCLRPVAVALRHPAVSGRLTQRHQTVQRYRTVRQPRTDALRKADLRLSDEQLRQQARLCAHQGEYQTAIALLSCVIERNPNHASDYNNRGLLSFYLGDWESALADYHRAVALNPSLTKVYNNRANCYVALGNLTAAIADYDTAIDLNPLNLHAWINRGITFRDLGLYDLALENFDSALQLYHLLNQQSDFPFLTGHIHAERGRTHHLSGDWNCAVADYQQALQQLPNIGIERMSPSHRLRHQVQHWSQSLLEQTHP